MWGHRGFCLYHHSSLIRSQSKRTRGLTLVKTPKKVVFLRPLEGPSVSLAAANVCLACFFDHEFEEVLIKRLFIKRLFILQNTQIW